MTIAAGVVCSDGILICADTEQMVGETRYQKQKIFVLDDFLLATGAGWTDYIKMTFDKLCDDFRASHPVNPSDARDIVEKAILDLHREHISEFHRNSYADKPSVSMIVATKCSNGEFALIKSSDTAVVLSRHYEVTGTGLPLFEYWASYFLTRPLSMRAATYILLFILREIKNSSYGCGGSTHVLEMPFEKKRWIASYYDEKEVLAGFPSSIIEVLLDCIEGSAEAEMDAKLNRFTQTIRDMRRSVEDSAKLAALHPQPYSFTTRSISGKSEPKP